MTRKPWGDEGEAADEPSEARDTSRPPARFYAPPGECVFCDRRRAAARKAMRSVRERGDEA